MYQVFGENPILQIQADSSNPNRQISHNVSKLASAQEVEWPPHANNQDVNAMIKVVLFGSASAKFALRAGGGVASTRK